MKHQRSTGLLAIVIYKVFVASLMAVTSIALLFTLKNHQSLALFSESYILETKFTIIEWLIDKVINISPTKLKLSGMATGAYAIVTAIESVGLWYEKSWATLLVLGLVGLSIPPEIFELIKGITILKLIVFLVNLAIFWYLLRHFSMHKK